MEWRQHATDSCHVEWLGHEGCLDVTGPGLRFARHFWKRSGGGASGTEARTGPSRFLRIDGGGDSSVHKFSLMENGTLMVRREGSNPFHSHALLTAPDPILVYPEGHYFEVRVRSLFRRRGPPERPRHHAPRTEGLVLGVTTSPAGLADASAQRVGHAAPGAWCISTSGSYSCGGDPAAARPRRPPAQEPVTPRRCWHETTGGAGKSPEMLRCLWPLPPEEPAPVAANREQELQSQQQRRQTPETELETEGGKAAAARPESARAMSTPSTMAPPGSAGSTVRPQEDRPRTGGARGDAVWNLEGGGGPPRKRAVAWTAALDEGDVVGLLVTPFGGLIVSVNGEKRLLLPDASVPCDVDLYPLVEVYNHVRSLQLVPRPVPPK